MKFNLYCDQQDDLEPYHGILLVESDPEFRGSFFDAFKDEGLDVHHFFEMERALSFWELNTGMIAVLDEDMLLDKGDYFSSPLQQKCPGRKFPYVVISNEPDYKRAVSYLKKGAMDYLVKDPTLAEYLPGLIRQLLGRLNADVELKQSQKALLENELELRSITENIEDVIIKTDENNLCTYISPAIFRVLKTPVNKLLGRSLLPLIHPDDSHYVENRMSDIISTRLTGKFEFRIRQDQGGYVWVEAFGTPNRGELNIVSGTILTLRDITHRKMIDRQLSEERNFSSTILETVGSLIAVLSGSGHIVRFNRACVNLSGLSIEEAYQRSFVTLLAESDDQKKFTEYFSQVLEERSTVEFESRMLTRSGETRTIQMVLSKLTGENSSSDYVVCTGLDITNRKIIEEEIRYMSFHDSLTGLYNRSYFEEELARLNSARQLPLSIIVGDVNGLKLINDAFGHEAGDRLIQAAATILRKTCRTDDITARIGGDEFGIILPGTNEEAALDIAARIRENSRLMINEPINVSIAVGVATKNSMEEDVRMTFKLADDRMYKNKLVESKSLKSAIISSLKKTLHERTNDKGDHSEQLKTLSLKLGKRLGFTSAQMDDLELLALLHDIGKIAVPDLILNKAAPLTEDEWEIMKQHPEIGYRIASTSPELSNIAEYILCHHEWIDGTGYPQGLQGESIPIISRALSVVDAYDAMTSGRIYKIPCSPHEALQELENFADKQFDGPIAREFIRMIMEEDAELLA